VNNLFNNKITNVEKKNTSTPTKQDEVSNLKQILFIPGDQTASLPSIISQAIPSSASQNGNHMFLDSLILTSQHEK
jgi:hypothetical protein